MQKRMTVFMVLLAGTAAVFGGEVAIDFALSQGAVKPLHGVNNAPVRVNGKKGQNEFKAAGIPFVRTHDTAYAYGGTRYVDIPNIFPNFDADETDPANYDFAFTDAYLKPLVEAGCQIFYRLGVTIENNWKIKAYNIYPPKDFVKWARICEHVVRHYNEGWANASGGASNTGRSGTSRRTRRCGRARRSSSLTCTV